MLRREAKGRRGAYTLVAWNPFEKFIRRLLKFVFMILAFVVAIVFCEVSFGMGSFWSGDFYNRSFNGRTGHRCGIMTSSGNEEADLPVAKASPTHLHFSWTSR